MKENIRLIKCQTEQDFIDAEMEIFEKEYDKDPYIEYIVIDKDDNYYSYVIVYEFGKYRFITK